MPSSTGKEKEDFEAFALAEWKRRSKERVLAAASRKRLNRLSSIDTKENSEIESNAHHSSVSSSFISSSRPSTANSIISSTSTSVSASPRAPLHVESLKSLLEEIDDNHNRQDQHHIHHQGSVPDSNDDESDCYNSKNNTVGVVPTPFVQKSSLFAARKNKNKIKHKMQQHDAEKEVTTTTTTRVASSKPKKRVVICVDPNDAETLCCPKKVQEAADEKSKAKSIITTRHHPVTFQVLSARDSNKIVQKNIVDHDESKEISKTTTTTERCPSKKRSYSSSTSTSVSSQLQRRISERKQKEEFKVVVALEKDGEDGEEDRPLTPPNLEEQNFVFEYGLESRPATPHPKSIKKPKQIPTVQVSLL